MASDQLADGDPVTIVNKDKEMCICLFCPYTLKKS